MAGCLQISVQIRTYHEVCLAVNESKRFALEAQAMLSLDRQMMQKHYAMMYGPQVQTWQEAVAGFPSGNALGLTTDGAPLSANQHIDGAADEERNRDGSGGYLTPPPAYGPPLSAMSKLMSTGFEPRSGQNTPTSSILSAIGYSSDGTDSTVSATPTPTRATFVVEETKTRATMTTATHPTCPMHALAQVHRAQDAVDAAADEAALRGTLTDALDAKNDVEMVRCLQVARGEISEAAETLRRTLGAVAEVGVDGNERAVTDDGEHRVDEGNTELDRKFMQSGIEAMTRLTSGEGAQVGLGEGAVAVGAPELPSWTITRYVTLISNWTLADTTCPWWTDTRSFERARLVWGSFRTYTSVIGGNTRSPSRCWPTVCRGKRLYATLRCGTRSIIRTCYRFMVQVVR